MTEVTAIPGENRDNIQSLSDACSKDTERMGHMTQLKLNNVQLFMSSRGVDSISNTQIVDSLCDKA